MVKANHVESPQQSNIQSCGREAAENGCYAGAGTGTGTGGVSGHHHTRNVSSSGSSQASSVSTNLTADWGSVSTTSLTSSSSSVTAGQTHSLHSDFSDSKLSKLWHKDDLIQSDHHTSASSSSEEYGGDDERIKLLCGDDVEDWQDGTGQRAVLSLPGITTTNRRRRIFPKLAKILHKVRRKLNWQLVLLLAMILVVAVSMSQLNDYQHSSVGIPGWNVNTTRDASVYLLPEQHTAILEPRIVDRDKRYLLLVIVCSALENFNTRQTIRQTWANGSEFNYAKYFNRMHSHVAHGSYAPTDHDEMLRVNTQLFGSSSSPESSTADVAQIRGGGGGEPPSYLIDRLGSQVIFLVGRSLSNGTQQQQLAEESAAFGDLLQEDFIDTYNNLTLKSLMLLKWISNFNADADRVKYVMKCDDDTFLNVPNLMHVLMGGTVPIYRDTLQLYTNEMVRRKSWADSTSLMGFLFKNARPIRDIASKWYAPRFMYRRKIFPNYLSGTGYVIEATRTAKELFRAALRTPIFHLEDVYVTGLCASKSSSTKPHHNPLFSFLRYAKRPCALRGMITQHPLTASDIRRAYDRLSNSSIVCEQPEEETIEKMLTAKSGGGRRAHGVDLSGFLGILVLGLLKQL